MRQYQKHPRPAREITCERCGIKFYIKGAGRSAKHCIECRVATYNKRTHKKKLDKS